jgi:hypothetical protein
MKTRSLLGIGALTMAGLISAACGGGEEMDGTGGAGTGGTGTDSGGTATDGGGGTSSGGTSTGGVGTGGVGTGGIGTGGSTGGSGTGGSTGGTSGGTDGGAGEGGMGGMGGGFGGAPCVSELPTMQVQTRSDTAADWDDDDFSDVTITLECPVALVSADWPHEAGYEDDDPGEANFESTKFNLEVINNSNFDYTGKQLNVNIRLVDDGRGPSAENGGYDIYVGLTDFSDFTEVATAYGEDWGEVLDANDVAHVTFVVPDDVAEFDPTNVYKAFIRVHSKFWGDGTDPVFDYDTSVFEISEFSVTDAP